MAIRGGRVRVDGRVVRDPLLPVVPETARVEVDGLPQRRSRWRALLFHKPRGLVTTRRDPEGRRTIYDALGDAGRGLVAVGRLDVATSGLLLLTTDTQLANWITDPAHEVPRLYAVTVRGRIAGEDVGRLVRGVLSGRDRLRAHDVVLRKASNRESHLVVELHEGRHREVRRLCEAIGHEVTRLKRVQLGGLDLGALQPGEWRELTPAEIAAAFPARSSGAGRSRASARGFRRAG